MGEFIWYFIMATVVGTAFLPLILREKCPSCKRRVLKTINPLDVIDPEMEKQALRFVTYFRCETCEHTVRRVRNGPMEVVAEYLPDPDEKIATVLSTSR